MCETIYSKCNEFGFFSSWGYLIASVSKVFEGHGLLPLEAT
jgi:hypothetical protein